MNVETMQRELPAAPGLGRRVLLVDDDPLQLKLVTFQLQHAGFVVEAARGAPDALKLLDEGVQLDAIVSDVVMDEVDGFSLCHELRRRAGLARMPIILMSSAFDEEADVALAREVGADALVPRTRNQQACIEALVRCMAEGAHGDSPVGAQMPSLHTHRFVHQLARMSDRKAAVEARFELLFESAHDPISVLTSEGVVLDVNSRWEEITGLTRDEMRGRPVSSFLAPGHESPAVKEFARIVDEGGGRSGPVPIRAADGRIVHLEFSTSTALIDGAVSVLAVGRDVTELVEAQRRLEASESHYRSLVEHVPDVIWTATKDWNYTYFSPNVAKLSGFTAEELYAGAGGRLARVHPDDVERVTAARESTTRTGAPLDGECRWQHRDGRWICVHLRGVVRENSIDGIFIDITEKKRLEEQLLHAQKLEAVGQLTAGVAHDFNNLLAVMSANASYLADTLPSHSEASQAAVDIADAAARATKITQQLLAFSRRAPCEPRPLDLREVLGGLGRMIVHAAGKDVAVTISNAPGLGLVRADMGQVGQVVMNLVVNARDAMGGKGNLHISTSEIQRDGTEDCTWGAVQPGPYVRLSVTDDGCGMDAATVERIFEPFFTTKPEGVGTGLGLSTCYGIVRHAGGAIRVETAPGAGTTFHVDFPRLAAAT